MSTGSNNSSKLEEVCNEILVRGEIPFIDGLRDGENEVKECD